MDNGLLAQVEDELHRLRNEKRWAELLEHRRFIIQLARQMRAETRITRRRLVRDFTRKQLIIGERIIRELEETKRHSRGGTD
jgi:hypothetical protein